MVIVSLVTILHGVFLIRVGDDFHSAIWHLLDKMKVLADVDVTSGDRLISFAGT